VKGERIESFLNHPLKRRENEVNIARIPGLGGWKGSAASIHAHRRIAYPHLWSCTTASAFRKRFVWIDCGVSAGKEFNWRASRRAYVDGLL
jgi:hypothetical protein